MIEKTFCIGYTLPYPGDLPIELEDKAKARVKRDLVSQLAKTIAEAIELPEDKVHDTYSLDIQLETDYKDENGIYMKLTGTIHGIDTGLIQPQMYDDDYIHTPRYNEHLLLKPLKAGEQK